MAIVPVNNKNPKVPVFPDAANRTAQMLLEIIDVHDEMSPVAYAALSRLCVLWAPGILDGYKDGNVAIVINDLVGLMAKLFPCGEGL